MVYGGGGWAQGSWISAAAWKRRHRPGKISQQSQEFVVVVPSFIVTDDYSGR
jgi:hypothetical protein